MRYIFTFKNETDYLKAWEYLAGQGLTFISQRLECKVEFNDEKMSIEDQKDTVQRLASINPAAVRWTSEKA